MSRFHSRRLNFATYNSSSPCNSQVNVKPDSAVGGAFAALSHPSTGIGINPNIISNADFHNNFWQTLGAHEMGHVMGYREVETAGCAAYTIMAGPTVPLPQVTPPGGPLCTDVKAAGDNYVNPNAEGNYSEPSQYEEDCDDVYLVVSLYKDVWDGQTNTLTHMYVGSVSYFLYTDCSGIPPI